MCGSGTWDRRVLDPVPDPDGACRRELGDIPWTPGSPLAAWVCWVVVELHIVLQGVAGAGMTESHFFTDSDSDSESKS